MTQYISLAPCGSKDTNPFTTPSTPTPDWHGLCVALANAPDMVAFWALIGRIRQAVHADEGTEADQ